MSKKDDGGPAFACANDYGYQGGMSLRDWFAGKALSGICASVNDEAMANAVTAAAKAHGVHEEEFAAKQAYALADAMLAEREKKE